VLITRNTQPTRKRTNQNQHIFHARRSAALACARARCCADARRPLARRYITWTQTHYPAGGPASQLLATLESCTRELLSVARYKDDIRYLRVWVQYVRARDRDAARAHAHELTRLTRAHA
jgi:hypothetical protein